MFGLIILIRASGVLLYGGLGSLFTARLFGTAGRAFTVDVHLAFGADFTASLYNGVLSEICEQHIFVHLVLFNFVCFLSGRCITTFQGFVGVIDSNTTFWEFYTERPNHSDRFFLC